MTLKSHYKVRLLNVSKTKCYFEDIITFGVNKYFNGNFDKLYSESLDFQEELHAKFIFTLSPFLLQKLILSICHRFCIRSPKRYVILATHNSFLAIIAFRISQIVKVHGNIDLVLIFSDGCICAVSVTINGKI